MPLTAACADALSPTKSAVATEYSAALPRHIMWTSDHIRVAVSVHALFAMGTFLSAAALALTTIASTKSPSSPCCSKPLWAARRASRLSSTER